MTKLRGSNNLIEKHLLEEEIPLLFGSTCNEAFQSPITNHLSCQKERLLSVPAIHLIPLLKTNSPF